MSVFFFLGAWREELPHFLPAVCFLPSSRIQSFEVGYGICLNDVANLKAFVIILWENHRVLSLKCHAQNDSASAMLNKGFTNYPMGFWFGHIHCSLHFFWLLSVYEIIYEIYFFLLFTCLTRNTWSYGHCICICTLTFIELCFVWWNEGSADDFHCTSHGRSPVIEGVDDAKEMHSTRKALSLLGKFSPLMRGVVKLYKSSTFF